MILVVDSGSTKADWRLIDDSLNVVDFKTIGLSPFFVTPDIIKREIVTSFPFDVDGTRVEKIYFYGAGCSSDDRKQIIKDGLMSVFSQSIVDVETDMFGAAKALYGNDKGIAAILGTGSNSCLWNGTSIVQGSPSLGFILGDEGSGAHLGMSLVKLYLNNELPLHLKVSFEEQYDVNRNIILDNVYKKPFPNKYLAGFTGFLADNISNPFIVFTITTCFIEFFEKHVKVFQNYKDYPLRCNGSVAFHFKEILLECAMASEIYIDKIIQSPIDELVQIIINDEHTRRLTQN